MNFWEDHIQLLTEGNFRALARVISLVENEADGYEELMMKLKPSPAKIIGITGAPGAGKSSLADALIREMTNDKKKVGVLCVDPSSPFNKGALLGDRIRMSEWYNHPDVFIRSLASKGSLGGLHPKIIEISEKIWYVIQNQKMKEIDKEKIKEDLLKEISKPGFNLYFFAKKYYKK